MLTICLVAYNEEKVIRRCLESVRKIADEIIVVLDGEPADRTREICLEYTEKVFVREHLGFSDPHLPFAFEQAKGDWIMRIDADEFLLPEAIGQIRELMTNGNADGYLFLWRLWNGKRYITKNKPHKPVLFKRSKLYFIGVPHGIMETYGVTEKVNIPLEHQPEYNNWSWNIFRSKHLKRIRLHAQLLFKKFDDVPKFNFSGKDYSSTIQTRKRFFFLFPFFAVYRFFRDITSGERNPAAMKVSFFRAVYEFLMGYFIFIETLKKFFARTKKKFTPIDLFQKIKLRLKAHGELLFIIIYGAVIISYSIYGVAMVGDEAIYSQVARETLSRNSWTDLYWSGGLWFEKPPLMIWATMLSFQLFGVSEITAHIFPVIFGLFGAILTYFFARELFKSRFAGFISGFVLLSVPQYIWFSRTNTLDIPVGIFIGMAMYAVWKILQGQTEKKWFLVLGLSIGLGVMTKSIVGLLPIIMIAFLSVSPKNRNLLLTRNLSYAGMSAALIALPWHLLMTIRHGYAFWDSYLGYHVFQRFEKNLFYALPQDEKGSFFYINAIFERVGVMEILFASSALLFFLLYLKNLKVYKDQIIFLLLWSGTIFLLFSFSQTKFLHYILPVFFPVAILMGGLLYIILREKPLLLMIPSALSLVNLLEDFYSKRSGPGELEVIITSVLTANSIIVTFYLLAVVIFVWIILFYLIFRRNKIMAGYAAMAVIFMMIAVFPAIPKKNEWVSRSGEKISFLSRGQSVNFYAENRPNGYMYPVHSILFYLPLGSRYRIAEIEDIKQSMSANSFCYYQKNGKHPRSGANILETEEGVLVNCN